MITGEPDYLPIEAAKFLASYSVAHVTETRRGRCGWRERESDGGRKGAMEGRREGWDVGKEVGR